MTYIYIYIYISLRWRRRPWGKRDRVALLNWTEEAGSCFFSCGLSLSSIKIKSELIISLHEIINFHSNFLSCTDWKEKKRKKYIYYYSWKSASEQFLVLLACLQYFMWLPILHVRLHFLARHSCRFPVTLASVSHLSHVLYIHDWRDPIRLVFSVG